MDQTTPDSQSKELLDQVINTPFPDDTPLNILQREYEVATVTLNAGFTTQTFNFPYLLFSRLAISKALSSFAYIRAGVKVRLKLTSTVQQAGAVIVSYLPCTNLIPTIVPASGNNAIVLNYSSQDTCTLTIPYMFPRSWMSTVNSYFDIGTVYVHELFACQAPPTTSSSVILSVYASFINVTTAGPVVPQSETEKKQRGIVSTVFSPLLEQADSMIEDFPFLNMLDKPDASCQIHHHNSEAWKNIAAVNTDGVVPSTSLTLKPGPLLPNRIKLFPGGSSNMSFANIAAQPMLHATFTYTTIHQSLMLPLYPQVFDVSRDYFSYVADFHRYWRGGIKYKIFFCTDVYTTARFAISYCIGSFNPVTDYGSGDIYTENVEVKGSTWHDFSVPYLHPDPWLRTELDPLDLVANVHITIVTAPTGAALPFVPSIRVAVFRSAAEDVQFAEPFYDVPVLEKKKKSSSVTTHTTTTTLSPVRSQCSLVQSFKKPFDSLKISAPRKREYGYCMTETTNTPANLMKRFSSAEALSPEDALHYFEFGEAMKTFRHLFMFWRGSVRVKVTPYTATLPAVYAAIMSVDGATTSVTANEAYPALFIDGFSPGLNYTVTYLSIPYQSNRPYQLIPGRRGANDLEYPTCSIASVSPLTQLNYAYAAGDDFVFGHLIAPATFT